ncbi:Hypothetical predicted protein [Octopus vulgaris]|uniref:Uncharacterized protein n=2 Tax=Octopus TaxID=6643 RepID=A0AA36FC73_OCTVU|nr:KICSTOR complex protein kaptin [Octopus sinensis]CAI9733716.1 Hypothetical predicted protein [Octopus vulgaris]
MGGRWQWIDAHFSCLPSQSNVYGLTTFSKADGTTKLLTGCMNGKVMSVEYHKHSDKLRPSSREIQFTYIPGDAELVAIDAFRKVFHDDELIIGIAFLKLEENENKTCQFLNIYSSWEKELDIKPNSDQVTPICQYLKLEFIPYQLTHTQLITKNSKETVFLLSGNDKKVHLYREDVSLEHSFMEVSVVEYFPEFQTITSCILWINIVYVDKNKQRITARGHQNGEIIVFLVEPLSKVILKQFSICHDGPITRVLLFTSESKVAVPACLEHLGLESNTECDVSDYHLLVVSAVEHSVVYKNVLNKEFSDQLLLPDSNKSDCVMCACAVDIDFDGQNELLLGTYGQELLAYKFQTIAPQEPASPIDNFDELQTMNSRRKAYSFSVSSKKMYKYTTGDLTSTPKTVYKDDSSMPDNWNINSYSPEVDIISDMFNTRPSFSKGQPQAGYQLLWHRSFASPVVAVEHADVMGDGMDDLIVLTLKGLHILQPNLTNVAEICFNKLNALLNSSMSNDENEKREAT